MEHFPIYTCSVLPNESKHMFLSWPCLMSVYERVPLMKNQSCAKQPFRARVPQGLFIFSLAISEPVGFQTPEKKTAQSPNRSQYSHEDGRFNRIIRGVAVVNSPSIQHDLCPIPVTPPCVTKACRPSSQTTFCCQRGGRKAVLHTPCHQRCSPKLPCICLRHHQKNRNYSIWNPIRFVDISGKDPPH